jgi:hypothetical protein
MTVHNVNDDNTFISRSNRALKEVYAHDTGCPVCCQPYEAVDVIFINPTPDQVIIMPHLSSQNTN